MAFPGPTAPPRRSRRLPSALWLTLACLLLLALAPPADAQSGVVFHDLAADPSSGLAWARTDSPRQALFDALKAQPIYRMPQDVALTPLKPWGAPGAAVLDFDGDGDLDLYIPNGPGTPNSLFASQLADTGRLEFVDVGVAAGVAATDQDSSGVCFGDLDNDGDPDLVVLGGGDANRLFENDGDGTFTDISVASGVAASGTGSTTCALGDLDGDGLLDLAVANNYPDWSTMVPILMEPFAQNEPNRLLVNRGGNRFEDVSEASGLWNLAGIPPGLSTITWAIALVDLDQDGDVDLIQADDQAVVPSAAGGGVDRGYLQVFVNDGTGRLTNRTFEAGTDDPGNWMSMSFGDFDCDGSLDVYASNIGQFMPRLLPVPKIGELSSGWYLGTPGALSLRGPDIAAQKSTPFAWGSAAFDVDNDGDLDLMHHGGLEAGAFVDASNAGALLVNPGCSAAFTRDLSALAADHSRRNGEGLAVGDLDGNGFDDIVSVSGFDYPAPIPLAPFPGDLSGEFGDASFVPTFLPTATPLEFTWSGIVMAPGSLAVELNGGNGNGWIQIDLEGSVGRVDGAGTNRDGVGAVVMVTPDGAATVRRPAAAGGGYASQNSPTLTFGLGSADQATVEVLWPGGHRNRLYGVEAGERITLPEIPCGFDRPWKNRGQYNACVQGALKDLRRSGVLSARDATRLRLSAWQAYGDARR